MPLKSKLIRMAIGLYLLFWLADIFFFQSSLLNQAWSETQIPVGWQLLGLIALPCAVSLIVGPVHTAASFILLILWAILLWFFPGLSSIAYYCLGWLFLNFALSPPEEMSWIFWACALMANGVQQMGSYEWKMGETLQSLLLNPALTRTAAANWMPVQSQIFCQWLTWSVLAFETLGVVLILLLRSRFVVWLFFAVVSLAGLCLCKIPEYFVLLLIFQASLWDRRWLKKRNWSETPTCLPNVAVFSVLLINLVWLNIFNDSGAKQLRAQIDPGKIPVSAKITLCPKEERSAFGEVDWKGFVHSRKTSRPSETEAKKLIRAQLEYENNQYVTDWGIYRVAALPEKDSILVEKVEQTVGGWTVRYSLHGEGALCLSEQGRPLRVIWDFPKDPTLASWKPTESPPTSDPDVIHAVPDLHLNMQMPDVDFIGAASQRLIPTNEVEIFVAFADSLKSGFVALDNGPIEERIARALATAIPTETLLRGTKTDGQKALILIPRTFQVLAQFNYLSIKREQGWMSIDARGRLAASGRRLHLQVLYGDIFSSGPKVRDQLRKGLLTSHYFVFVGSNAELNELTKFQLSARPLETPYQLVYIGTQFANELSFDDWLHGLGNKSVRDLVRRGWFGNTRVAGYVGVFSEFETSLTGDLHFRLPPVATGDMAIFERQEQ